jgi:hypothetical protein
VESAGRQVYRCMGRTRQKTDILKAFLDKILEEGITLSM